MQFPFGPFAPDAGANAAGICQVADGVLPKVEGYGPAPALVSPGMGDPLPGEPRGSITCIKRDGQTAVFFFTVDALYMRDADNTWSEIDDGYNCTEGDDWSAEHFGNMLLYTNTTDGMWAYNIETGSAPVYIPEAGDPRFIFVLANMVFGVDCIDGSGNRDNRLIKNSDFNRHDEWKKGAADTQPLEYGAELVCGVNLKNSAAITFQREAMRILQFGNAGGGAMYSLRELANGRGSVGQKSVVAFDGVVYALASNGFFRFSMGAGLETIGEGFVDQWFFQQVASADLKDVQAAIDPQRKIVLWLAPNGLVLGYCWAPNIANHWFTWQNSGARFISRLATSGYTLDAASAIWGTLDNAPQIPLDDRFWSGGEPLLAALRDDLSFGTFSGEAQAATIETSISNSPISTLISRATPIDDAAGGTLALGVTDRLDTSLEWKPGEAKSASGSTPQRGRGKNSAWRRSIPAGEAWTYAKGVDHIQFSGGGGK